MDDEWELCDSGSEQAMLSEGSGDSVVSHDGLVGAHDGSVVSQDDAWDDWDDWDDWVDGDMIEALGNAHALQRANVLAEAYLWKNPQEEGVCLRCRPARRSDKPNVGRGDAKVGKWGSVATKTREPWQVGLGVFRDSRRMSARASDVHQVCLAPKV